MNAQTANQRSTLIVENLALPVAHEIQGFTGNHNRLYCSILIPQQLPGEGDLPSIPAIKEDELFAKRCVIQWIYLLSAREQKRAIGTSDVPIQRPCWVDKISALGSCRLKTWDRFWLLDCTNDMIAVFGLLPSKLTAFLHPIEARLDDFQQIRLGNIVGRPDDTEFFSVCDRCQTEKQHGKKMVANRHEVDSGRVASAMDFEMRTFRAHFGDASHIRFADVPSVFNGIMYRYRLIVVS